ncbi:phosphate ABC transporter substrate-binding protein PstS [Helicobacter sp. 13S00401-1]|uniref:phosphate ABC transporter substrate-binding protein PstS n=1 Tax=Helicobacter sp. 13S00401-1 TaxID=1905758 RepID=UPI000BA673AC|nr:phosphate ABC transporter substrate-binding protein PstS [Helicobacter sp. 13S00401-1]PAF51387.1 phosphate ABC transporter substrate-binding protein PstS [Helicobacter sp. 13S00401-1]
MQFLKHRPLKVFLVFLIAFISTLSLANARDLQGAGASFPADVYYAWVANYRKIEHKNVNYQSIGSGGGIRQVKAHVIDFGASDEALSSANLAKANLYQFPTVIGAIVVAYNLEGIKDGELKLSNEIVSDIFLKKITKWDDPRILALNPSLKLPDAKIFVVHRSDGSGTTYNFSRWLGDISKEWKDVVGVGKSLPWPTGVGAKGNEGVSQILKQTKNTIGYVELSYKVALNLSAARLQDGNLKDYVYPDAKSIALAASGAIFTPDNDFQTSLIAIKKDGAYPITSSTFILLPKHSKRSPKVKEFFKFSFEHSAALTSDMGFLVIPKSVQDKVMDYLKF